MAADGKSLITSVGSQDSTVWLHDKDGDHQISSEGNAAEPSFSGDGSSLYYLMANGRTPGYELRVEDLTGGKEERVLPGYSMETYSVSRDGKMVAFAMNDSSGQSSLWVAFTDRRSSPTRISSTALEDSPHFLPDGDLVFRAIEGGSNFLYRMKPDGTGRRKISSRRVFDIMAVSPDGRWVVGGSPVPSEEVKASASTASVRTTAFPVDGGEAIPLCQVYCLLTWNPGGTLLYIYFPSLHDEGSYALPVLRGTGLPDLPPSGIAHIEDLKAAKPAAVIPQFVNSAISPSVYAYTRRNTRRNLYRIPLP